MTKIIVKQVKSVINRPSDQKKTMIALGLRKIGSISEFEATPQILGMVRKVNHLVETKEL
ncbi:MAG: 50S ribosomal protein L30 [Bacteroidales bacterium]|nr:50S ribosomal protein L30 [Bacteroidales bacterium]